MFKYKTDSYSTKISKIEITRETEKSVFYKRKRFGEEIEERSAKESQYTIYHDTFDDAKSWLVNRYENKIKNCERQMVQYNDALSDVLLTTEDMVK